MQLAVAAAEVGRVAAEPEQVVAGLGQATAAAAAAVVAEIADEVGSETAVG